jgi:hypothetical protein
LSFFSCLKAKGVPIGDNREQLHFFKVDRKEEKGLSSIFDMAVGSGGFVFSDQFIQISTVLDTDYIYGFGENVS